MSPPTPLSVLDREYKLFKLEAIFVKDRQKNEKRKGLLVSLFLTLLPSPINYAMPSPPPSTSTLITHHILWRNSTPHSRSLPFFDHDQLKSRCHPRLQREAPAHQVVKGVEAARVGGGVTALVRRRAGKKGSEARMPLVHLEGGTVMEAMERLAGKATL